MPPVSKNYPPRRKVVIENIRFDGPIHLSDTDVTQVIAAMNERDLDADNPHWTEQFAEIGLRGAWQDRGYFRVMVTAEAHSLGGEANVERFQVSARVNEGLQYRLGNLRFTGGTAIPDRELRQAFPLRDGELFSVDRVRTGLEALTKLYASHGYIDFTAAPDTEVDDNLQRVSLSLQLNEGNQYRVGNFEIRGLDSSLEARLRSMIVPREIFNPEPVLAFIKENRTALPPRGLHNLQVRRNENAGIVDLTFDARSCP